MLEKLHETLKYIKSKTRLKPATGIVLGSGLGTFIKELQVEVTVPFKDIPHFHAPTVEGHSGNLIFGKINGKDIVALQGRNHFYEGHSLDLVVFPVRVLALLGVEKLILTNSAGGFGENMKAGDLMIITDHINLTCTNPLIGPNLKEFGPRFPDMTEAYDKAMIAKLESSFQNLGYSYHKGIYIGVLGPSYETPAEVRFLKVIGGSAVGMSTVPECIVANHMGVKVAGLSCITNLAAGVSGKKLTHNEVTETAKLVEHKFSSVLKHFISNIDTQ